MRAQKFRELSGKKNQKVKVDTNSGKLTAFVDTKEIVVNPYNIELDSATAEVVASDVVETKVIRIAATESFHKLIRIPEEFDRDGLVKVTFAATTPVGTAWVADTATALGDIVVPTTGEDGLYFVATDVGVGDTKTHAATEPTWAGMEAGDTVVDDEVTWTAIDRAQAAFTITSKSFTDGSAIKQTGTDELLDSIYVYPADASDEEIATLQSVYVNASDLGWVEGGYYSVEITRTAIAYSADTYDRGGDVDLAGIIFTLPIK